MGWGWNAVEPEKTYGRREQTYGTLQTKQERTANRLSNFRLLTITLGLAASIFAYRASSPWGALAMGLLTLTLFGYLALQHQRVRRQLRYTAALRDLARKGRERVAGRWGAFPDTGAEFRDDGHPYASDLDLFGQGSLFQWINSAQTALGRATLAGWLRQEPGDPSEIMDRQEAVTELGRSLAWRAPSHCAWNCRFSKRLSIREYVRRLASNL